TEERDADPRCDHRHRDRRHEKERQEIRGAPLLLERCSHQIKDDERAEKDEVFRNVDRPLLTRRRELIRDDAPELSAQKRRAIEREQRRKFLRILVLEKEERDVQKKKDVNRMEVLASSAEHGR